VQGKFLATGQAGTDSDAAVWDLGSLELVYRLEEHDHGIADVAFSKDEVRTGLLLVVRAVAGSAAAPNPPSWALCS
jgi:WD40 repeat protein